MKVNGLSSEQRTGRCSICGAKMTRAEGEYRCPNRERKDHKGQPYHGRA